LERAAHGGSVMERTIVFGVHKSSEAVEEEEKGVLHGGVLPL
jgi:hypothetical protein